MNTLKAALAASLLIPIVAGALAAGHYKRNNSLQASVAIVNENGVNCVVASLVKYMVTQPVIIETINQNGMVLSLYEANLVGVLIGNNPRPVMPPVRTFFVLNEQMSGAMALSGA